MIKKTLAILLVLVLVLSSLVSCGADPQADLDKQAEVIAANQDIWAGIIEEEDYYTWYYGITDLDQNGRLEVIVTSCQGTGFFSNTSVFEVNEARDGIEEIPFEIPEMSYNSPDLIFVDAVNVYKYNDTYAYVLYDEMKNGYAEDYNVKEAIYIEDGMVKVAVIGCCEILLESENWGEAKFYDWDDNEICHTQFFDYLEGQFFMDEDGNDAEKYCTNWDFEPIDEEGVTAEAVLYSYSAFELHEAGLLEVEDTARTLIDNLDLYYWVGLAYPNEPAKSDTYGDWVLVKGEIEGDEWYADNVDAYGHVSIKNGKMDFSYDQYEYHREFNDMEIEFQNGGLWYDCENDIWYFSHEYDNRNYFEGTLIDDDTLVIIWQQGNWDEDEYVAAVMLTYERQ